MHCLKKKKAQGFCLRAERLATNCQVAKSNSISYPETLKLAFFLGLHRLLPA